jgi:hypothetical protein
MHPNQQDGRAISRNLAFVMIVACLQFPLS